MSHADPNHWSNKWNILEKKFKRDNAIDGGEFLNNLSKQADAARAATFKEFLDELHAHTGTSTKRTAIGDMELPSFLSPESASKLSESFAEAFKSIGGVNLNMPDGRKGVGIPIASPRHLHFFIEVLGAAMKLEMEEPSFEALYAAMQKFETRCRRPRISTKSSKRPSPLRPMSCAWPRCGK